MTARDLPRYPGRTLMWVGAAALFVAALDAYAVVTLLPAMLTSLSIPLNDLQAASPVVSGFLAGYVIGMPLSAAAADLGGRRLALSSGLVVFAGGSLVTALSGSLAVLVAGRAVQGIGGGALVPPTLALAADLFPAGRRGLPAGAVVALQEAGSVLGPVYGTVVAATPAGWRTLFWVNLPLCAVVAALVWPRPAANPAPRPGPEGSGQVLGAALLAAFLGLMILGLYPNAPDRSALNTGWPLLLAAAGVAALALALQQLMSRRPWLSRRLLASRVFAAAGASNLLAGAGLMVALVDVPVVATGVYGLSSSASGLLLSRLLVGIPAGAALGGLLTRSRLGRVAAAGGMALAAASFVAMSSWTVTPAFHLVSPASAELLVCGLGFGLALAPLTASLLDLGGEERRALMGGAGILARSLGMILALSALTAFGLHRFQAIVASNACASVGPAVALDERVRLYEQCLRASFLKEYQEIFTLTAVGLVLAAALALAALWPGRQRDGSA